MTRIWEFEDDKAAPDDLVREQDFILRLRRIQRHGTAHLVINLVLGALESVARNRGALETMQERLREFAKVTHGIALDMSNGDLFIIWDELPATQSLAAKLGGVLLPGGTAEDIGKYLLTYNLPADYMRLRERANHYVESARIAALSTPTDDAGEALKSRAATGPLTAWSVDQIGRLLDEIDVRRYTRTQTIYSPVAGGGWKPVREEFYVSFEDLRRERFPKLEIITPEHLFLALCEMIDQQLLADMTENPQALSHHPLHLNLSVAAVMGAVFAQFARSVPNEQRGMITFELHRGDLLQDFARTLGAIEVLKKEGFKVAIDSVTPDMVNYLNLSAFGADYIKINVGRDRAAQLADPAIRKGLAQIPAAQLIFFRCDNDRALAAGRELGVTLFQGWLIDDVVAGNTPG